MRLALLLFVVGFPLGCAPAQVFVVDSHGKPNYECGPGRGAYITPDGKAAVCMRQSTAEFVTCATAIGAGDFSYSEEHHEKLAAEYQGAGLTQEQKDALSRAAKESTVLADARGKALLMCLELIKPDERKRDDTKIDAELRRAIQEEAANRRGAKEGRGR